MVNRYTQTDFYTREKSPITSRVCHKFISVFLCFVLTVVGFGTPNPQTAYADETPTKESNVLTDKRSLEPNATASNDNFDQESLINEVADFKNLDDEALTQYIEDTIYATLEGELASDDYRIESVEAVYHSKYYLEDLAYNSKENIFFGYTLKELDDQFQGQRYVFTLGDNGETVVQAFENYDDTYLKAIKDVAIGTGVILVCVTVSAVSAGAGAPAIAAIFAVSAKTGTTCALGSAALGGVFAGTITGIQTGDFEEAQKAAVSAAADGFKWGAITGVVTGGLVSTIAINNAVKATQGVTGIKSITEIKDTETLVNILSSPTKRVSPYQSELDALAVYGGDAQKAYLGGKEVISTTPGSTRPDVIRKIGDIIEAIEVKNYNLNSSASRNSLYQELKRQVSSRVENLPEGSLQRIVLDVRGGKYSEETINTVVSNIWKNLDDIYPNIPIDLMW